MAQLAPPPTAFGLPYSDWRKGQWEMICGILDSPQQFHLVVAPTGFGKSLLYMGISALSEDRAVCLTATKALQDQLNRDFGGGSDDGSGPLGLYDVRGRGAYPCTLAQYVPSMAHLVRPGATAATAPCRWGFSCPLKDTAGCPYFDKVGLAHLPKLLVTNYDFWLYNPQRRGETNILVMDEAHQAPQELADFFSFKFTTEMLRYFDGHYPENEEVEGWIEWHKWATEKVERKLEQYRGGKPPDALMELASNLSKMVRMKAGEWVVERGEHDGSWSFDCIRPEEFGKFMWGDVIGRGGKVVLVSATANLMTAQAIGIDPAKCKVWEATSGFPIERRPVWAVNGAVQVNYRMQEADKRLWVTLIDRILGPRLEAGLKGIIHTTSFERARYLQQYSRHSSKLLLNESRNTREVVAAFKRSRTGLALVSPSVTTGYDFPYEECRFQIIGKVPFPDLRSKAAKIKAKRNKEWAGYMAAQELVQSAGRGMRGADDWCETFIADGSFGWWWKANRKWTPKWFQAAVVGVEIGKLPGILEVD